MDYPDHDIPVVDNYEDSKAAKLQKHSNNISSKSSGCGCIIVILLIIIILLFFI
ncbi:hypothetical protein [Apilactobacillus micheneri]|uniref:hypothetical protein n=1 Tax=Apilactobacillus micheneri TaxID=1899430 RepID=UPI0015E82CA5|nr:hypothetical protein [Apilactobacillus micheneri]